MKKRTQIQLVVLVGVNFLVSAMPFNNRRRNQLPPQPVVVPAPLITRLQEMETTPWALQVYARASNAIKRETQNRTPVWNIELCGAVDHEFLNQQMVATKIIELQYFADDVLDEYVGQLVGFWKATVSSGGFRIMCTKREHDKTLVIHAIRARTGSTYNDNETFAVQHQACR